MSPTSNASSSSPTQVAGNAPPHVKEFIFNAKNLFANHYPELHSESLFCGTIGDRFHVTEVSVHPKTEDKSRMEGRVVCEIEVTEDMLNGLGHMHGACAASMIDMCSTLALYTLAMTTSDEQYLSVSQTMNVMYHSPATLGDKPRLVNTTIAMGARTHSAQTEVWNETRHRLVATGAQIKMVPSTKL